MLIHWFRRDFRLRDNPALHAAHTDGNGRVIPVYILSDWQGSHRWSGPARQATLCGALRSLNGQLESLGTRLVLRRGDVLPELERLLRETNAEALYFNRSPDPAGRALEQRVEAMARTCGVRVRGFHEVTVFEPDRVLTKTGHPFRVFTPFSRAWLQREPPAPLPPLKPFAPAPIPLPSLPLPTLADWGLGSAPAILEPGEPAAHRRMETFLGDPVFHYAGERDLPALDATSHLSADLRWGTLSPRLLVQRTRDALAHAGTAARREGARKFLGELIWREFYMAVLWHWPDVLDWEFQPRFRGLKWDAPGTAFQRWCEGTTGFPLVDAGMRQLAATGWMHNRVRMVVSMFLTKDLHMDWRHGEAFFMRSLADGEIASNNGGWQWSAGVGADAAPYFRIQNPWTQTARYDPDGSYIKRWVPELADVPPGLLTKAPSSALAPGYPLPMVDHAREREITLDRFAALAR
jgi:deoxyribodipyrimidine photo-lyase